MTKRGAGCWESRLSGSERGREVTQAMGEILWHRWETKRQTENTNFALQFGERPTYSKLDANATCAMMHRVSCKAANSLGMIPKTGAHAKHGHPASGSFVYKERQQAHSRAM